MSRIPDDVIERVRDAADIVELIGKHVPLKRAGSDYRGACPFHGGTHRNFAVIPKKGMYYCFVCHEGGDAFSFYMRKFGMDYPTAVREIAAQVGIAIPERGPAGPDPREPLLDAAGAAADWFMRQLRELPEGEAARRYLAGRGFALESVLPHGLGYAPRGVAFLEAMAGLGLGEDVLLEAGLAHRRDDGTIAPRFRGRLLFSIHDVRGRVVGFGGRVIGPGEPKYLNSPDSPIFHKGKLIYNLHGAKGAIRKAERVLVVEGYFDVLRLALVGLDETVAPLGTGFTPEQAELLGRYTRQVVLLYDSDEAGLKATFRAGDVLLGAGLRVSVATLPAGADPDSIVGRGGAEALAPYLRDAIDLLERKIQILERHGWLGSLRGRRRALDRLLPTVRACRDPITRELYLSRAAEAVGIRADVLARELAERPPRPRAASAVDAGTDGKAQGPVPAEAAERLLLGLWIEGEPWRARVRAAVQAGGFERADHRALYEALEADTPPEALPTELAAAYEAARAALASWEPDLVFDAAVRRLRARELERRVAELDDLIPLAPEERKLELITEKQRVTGQLRALLPRYKAATRTQEPERRSSASRS